MTRTASALATLAALAGLAACGGSDKPLTRAQLIAKADPICRKAVRRVDYSKFTPATIVRFGRQLAAAEQTAHDNLAELRPPASLEPDWTLMLDDFQDSAREFRTLERAPHPQREGGRFEPLYGHLRKRAWIAREDGFKDCGQY